MKVLVDLVLSIDGIHMRKGGEFDVRKRSDISLLICRWINQIKMDTGYRDTEIVSVYLDGSEDLTEEVRLTCR
ncbi:hypothetical protein [Rossellomorea marisflavi]|uniref:Uncharacterized protein n=1 Tax=Rossellomorea marisflavi TaxID=189381 RepID=A0A0J5VIH0_9BACI|nr:hypothetical protein [Rossellomorea marisflavi]KML06779.1 hypothetical protein VL06_06345 [Rossellomorea marisflavi]KML35436.1 hypothetical protein VL12_01225 [Rossellomorea marisflavi]KZE45227.1 hypothetical protein AV649_03245 [Rossellomorea marisflavi]MCM2603925.1 hypothetical protein [Rossellomorea marisflavi]